MTPGAETLAGVEAGATPGAAGAGDGYAEVRRRIVEDLVPRLIPRRAVVAVVSKGDNDLLNFDDRIGRHFPGTAEGQYAGFHPRDGRHAVEELEAARDQGAQYLLIPSPYFWWFEHYPELERHLDRHYRLLGRRTGACAVYFLGDSVMPQPGTASLGLRPGQAPASPAEAAALVEPIGGFLDTVVPPEETVLVASDGADELLAIGREAWHFPHDENGRPRPFDPEDDFDVVAQLDTLREAGLRFLVVPRTSFWQIEQSRALRHYLRHRCRLIAVRERVCALFEIGVEAADHGPAAKLASPAGEARVPWWRRLGRSIRRAMRVTEEPGRA